ncbi:hypothetical protein CEXT_230911 [Caerostris extrusa]|uniref:MATH domain-containing protein n=1 Tax=Caerostris extrusa TaxID=172846 RepID=A0AAV4RPK0_CAEEX|nr:hypothetical protein CEXT_230911 [Caerostris extrusa]
MKYFVFTWTIKNFSYWWQRSPDRIVSPTYIVNAIENTKWKLCTYKKNNDNEKISLLLNREEDNYSSDIVLDYELAILEADETTLVSGTKEDQTFKRKVSDLVLVSQQWKLISLSKNRPNYHVI